MSHQPGYHLNIARHSAARAWDWTHTEPRYCCHHFASVYLGEDRDVALSRAAEFATRFECGTGPEQFVLSLTKWQTRGENVAIPE